MSEKTNAKIEIDPKKFALAVIESSPAELDPAEKLELYKQAYLLASKTKTNKKSKKMCGQN
jgi:hypothetical protein